MTGIADGPSLAARLRHVRWIGGGTGAGKSTVARRLAGSHDLHLYSTDDALSDHMPRMNPVDHPLVHAFLAMDMDERWVNRPPSVMLETFHGFQGEGFELIVEDLLALPSDRPILAEGFRLLPRLVAPVLSQPKQAVWLIPTPEFRRAAFDARGFTWEIPRKTNNSERALTNLLIRDDLFTAELRKEAAVAGLATLEVDVGVTSASLTERVRDALGLV